MDNHIMTTVCDTLDAHTEQIALIIADRNALDEKIKSGRYSAETVQKELYPKRNALEQQIKAESDRAIQAAQALVEKYRADAEALDELNPADITEDIKLLQAGVPLLPRDIQAILKRSNGNRTMTQLTLRYAKEHGIDTDGAVYFDNTEAKQIADGLDSILRYYANWIGTPNAQKMLHRFFSMT